MNSSDATFRDSSDGLLRPAKPCWLNTGYVEATVMIQLYFMPSLNSYSLVLFSGNCSHANVLCLVGLDKAEKGKTLLKWKSTFLNL